MRAAFRAFFFNEQLVRSLAFRTARVRGGRPSAALSAILTMLRGGCRDSLTDTTEHTGYGRFVFSIKAGEVICRRKLTLKQDRKRAGCSAGDGPVRNK